MARIESGSKRALELRVVRYQFPAGEREEWDANWLVIEVDVVSGADRWTARYAALTTWEVADLILWFRNVAGGVFSVAQFDATEPCVAFAAERDDNGITLTALLRLEFCRPGLEYERRIEGEGLEFHLHADDVCRFADELEIQSAPFPKRAAAG